MKRKKEKKEKPAKQKPARLDEDNDSSGVLIPAGILIGMGLGFIFDQLVGGLFLGLGLGFVAFFIARHKK